MIRTLTDDTLVVFLSDSHIGGSDDRDIFESPDDLAALFDGLNGHLGPVELILAGDFFDLLRIADVASGENRAGTTILRPEYRELFAALRRFASRDGHRVVYLPGNHDAEAWWNEEVRAELERQQLVHDFALSYTASFESAAEALVYCEHGNQFDPPNTFTDFGDPLDTPLGDHIVTDVLRHLPRGWDVEGGNLREIDRVFPLTSGPQWLVGRVFYYFSRRTVYWVGLPLLVLLIVHDTLAYAAGHRGGVAAFAADLTYDIALIVVVFGIFILAGGRIASRFVKSSGQHVRNVDAGFTDEAVDVIRDRLERGETPPLGERAQGKIRVFVSGHTHAPSLNHFDDGSVLVNSGCWLRQLQPVPAHLGVPPVFVSRFVQTHVRVHRTNTGIDVELWEHPRPTQQCFGGLERLAIARRIPAEPEDVSPRIQLRTSVHVGV